MELKIRDLMKVKGIRTYKELAELSGMSTCTLSLVLRGNPQLSTLEKLAKTLDCDVSDLFGKEKNNTVHCPHCGGVIHLTV